MMSNMISPVRPTIPEPVAPKPVDKRETNFLDSLQDAIGQVEALQSGAERQVNALLEGTGQDVHGAMIAVERADLSFQLMMQVRNKIVNAYQEVARMQF